MKAKQTQELFCSQIIEDMHDTVNEDVGSSLFEFFVNNSEYVQSEWKVMQK